MIDLRADRFAMAESPMSGGASPDVIEGTHGDDRLDGTNHADVIEGLAGDDVIQGLSGADSLTGGGGDDTLLGGSGDDTIDGGLRTDSMAGGSGDDLIYVDHILHHPGYFTLFDDMIDGGSGSDTVSFVQVADALLLDLTQGSGAPLNSMTGIENIVGSPFDDVIYGFSTQAGAYDGGDGDDELHSMHQRDTLTGGAGDDILLGQNHGVLIGGAGSDDLESSDGATMDGGDGADKLWAQGKHLLMTGGEGADTFLLFGVHGRPTEVTDLEAQDVVDLHFIDADIREAGDQAFTFVSGFDGHAGEAKLAYDAGTDRTSLLLDTDGDGKAEFTFLFDGDHTDFSNFVL